jgi:hypothetical protein
VVQKLIAGPSGFICNECVGECNRIIAAPPDGPERRVRPAVQSLEELESMSTGRLFGWLKIEAAVFENAGNGLHNTVAVLRKREVPLGCYGRSARYLPPSRMGSLLLIAETVRRSAGVLTCGAATLADNPQNKVRRVLLGDLLLAKKPYGRTFFLVE